jgi:hypothetical protein
VGWFQSTFFEIEICEHSVEQLTIGWNDVVKLTDENKIHLEKL